MSSGSPVPDAVIDLAIEYRQNLVAVEPEFVCSWESDPAKLYLLWYPPPNRDMKYMRGIICDQALQVHDNTLQNIPQGMLTPSKGLETSTL